jgi:hypothetical protein
MNFRKLMIALPLAFVFSASCVHAQDQQPQQTPDNNAPQAPLPPAPPDDTGGGGNNQPSVVGGAINGVDSGTTDSTIQQDAGNLAGPQAISIVSPNGKPNVFDPALHLSVGPDTGIDPGETNTDVTLGGTLAFDHFWNRNEFTTQYSGGFNIYEPASFDNSQYHVLSIIDISQIQRFTLRFRDDLSDSYGAVFGGFNTGGPGVSVPAGFVSTLSPTFTLAQTILTTNANRIGNTALGEIDYALSHHSTLTFAGSYQILHFLTSGYVDSSYVDGRVGYSFQVDRKNAVALTYDYNYTTFNGVSGAVASHTPQIAYGLKLNGRLAFQVAGGPQILVLQNSTGTGTTNQFSWSVSSVLTYKQRRTTYSLNYSHGLTNGSGVYLGAISDTITGTVQGVVHRVWTPSITGGYSDNDSLAIDTTMSSFYGNYYATVALGRIWGRSVHTTASYGLQEQTTNAAACPVTTCTASGIRQVFTLTLDWHLLPTSTLQ